MTGEQFVQAARAYTGVRWRHQGRSSLGVDCIGLVILAAHDLGLTDHDQTDYGRIPDGQKLQQELSKHLIKVDAPQVGDVLLMRFDQNPQHVAIKTDLGILHAYAQVRRVVEHRLDDVWASRILATYRFKEISACPVQF